MSEKPMTREEMLTEIQRVLEDANEWEVRDVYEYVMDEVGGEEVIQISNLWGKEDGPADPFGDCHASVRTGSQ